MPRTSVLDLTASVPRSGRRQIGGYAWLGRLADKARAEAACTGGEYLAYCPLSMGFLQRAGVAHDDFDGEIRAGRSDDELVQYFDRHVSPQQKAAANAFVLDEMASHLDEQDADEGQ